MTVPVLAPRPGRPVIPTPTRPQLMLTHCESEWSALYPKIERLYIRERRKLRYIIQHMESEHGFVATKQMYKKRLAKWGLQKNTKRAAPTKSSPKTKVQCRKAPATSVSPSDSTSDSTPSAIFSIPASPDISHSDGSMLMLLTNVRTWSVAFFETTVQFRDELLQQNLTAWQIWHANNKSINFAFKLVVDLLDRGKGDLAGRMARKAFVLVEDMLTLEGPALVWNLLEMMHHMVTLRHARLFQMLLAHVTALASTKKPENHPLPLMLRGLTEVVRSLTNTASRSANSSPSFPTGADRETVPLTSGHISQSIAPLLEQIWILNAELLFKHFDPRLFHLYCRVIWDSCSINPPAMIVNSADYWINRIDTELLPEMTGAASLDNPVSPDGSYGQRSTFVQSLLSPRIDFSPPRDYEMLRTSSITALRQYGSALAQGGLHDLNDTTKLFGVLAGLATANILERPPSLNGELGAFDNMGIEELLRLHAGNFACVLRILVDLDSELGGNELLATLDAVERIRVMVRLREYSEGKLDPQVIRELWLLRDALVTSGKSVEADVVEKDAYDRMERFIEDISAYSG